MEDGFASAAPDSPGREEGTTMSINDSTEPQDEDVAGHQHKKLTAQDEGDDVQGHRRTFQAQDDDAEDDVEGHRRTFQLQDDGAEDDVEGHRRTFQVQGDEAAPSA